ncbi:MULTISPECIES: ArnT family glycosyltransferase [unclassified Nitrospina]|uniref:ArnT family glycosyltransferase n=1 Tax=unclassified Nitrospina TaxID=2638683 RepID=UPI003F9D2EC8
MPAQEVSPDTSRYRIILVLAVLSFLPTLFLPYTGEEGVYTITSMEMVHRSEWRTPTFYGEPYPRPPLMNWLVIPLAHITGWENVLVASRLVAALATVGTGCLLFAFVSRVYRNSRLAFMSVLFFFSGDVLFFRGWLAYADPLFGIFVFIAVASLILAVHENRVEFLIGVAFGLAGSFLTKAVTGYVFYAVALGAVFILEKSGRRMLGSPLSILMHALALLVPLFWWGWVEGGGTHSAMLKVLIDKLSGGGSAFSPWTYFKDRVAFLTESFIVLLPGSAIMVLLIFQNRTLPSLKDNSLAKIVAWLVFLNYLPYLFALSTNIRYILPLYPWCALLFALWVSKPEGLPLRKWMVPLFSVMVAMKLVFTTGAFLWYKTKGHLDAYPNAARQVMATTGSHPLYVVDSSSLGLSVTAHIDSLGFPKPPLTKPGPGWTDAFVLAREYQFPDDRVVTTYPLPGGTLYLRCRGTVCPK